MYVMHAAKKNLLFCAKLYSR